MVFGHGKGRGEAEAASSPGGARPVAPEEGLCDAGQVLGRDAWSPVAHAHDHFGRLGHDLHPGVAAMAEGVADQVGHRALDGDPPALHLGVRVQAARTVSS